MLRRSHKKSRQGCLQCKQRHVKCDEKRPICVQCTLSGRDCSYTSQTDRRRLQSSHGSAQDGLKPRADNLDSSSATGNSSPTSRASPAPETRPEEIINLDHIELLVHLTTDKNIFNLGGQLEPNPAGMLFVVKESLKSPYLLYQLLAFSSRHLAFLRPERSVAYLDLAVALQTKAIALFNSSSIQINESNCVAVLLFSIVLGHHLLADTLSKRDSAGLPSFLSHYTQYAQTHRGIYTVVMTAWPLLMESELESILQRSANFTSRSPQGSHCQLVTQLIASHCALRDEDKTACHRAIRYLQLGFDAIFSPDSQEREIQNQMIFLWAMLVPREFTDLLVVRQPEALVVLGYYALLLHHGREMWQVGDAGRYLLGLIVDYLGPEWAYWLSHLRQEISSV